MARHFFSRVRYLHSLRGFLSHPCPFRAPPVPYPFPAQETLFFSGLRRPTLTSPSPRHYSHSSSASVADEEVVCSESEDGKADCSGSTPKGGTKGLVELFSCKAGDSNPKNGKFRRKGSGPGRKKKPLYQFFKESVGLSSESGDSEELEVQGEEDKELRKGIEEMKKNLRALEQKMKNMKKKTVGKPQNLAHLFAASNEEARKKSSKAVANGAFPFGYVSALDLSPTLVSFVERLLEEGHMKKANFLKDGKLELDSLCSSYARDFVRSAAEKFAQEHQAVAKWLSGSELKKVALVGCPQIDRKTAFSAKRLRAFFEIQEDGVCEACKLKELCSFRSAEVQTEENLQLVNVLRVLIVYALNSVHPQLPVSEETKESVSRLLAEIVNLSK